MLFSMSRQGNTTMSDLDGATETSRRKRPASRVYEACGACRNRKTRCDGRKPVCRACESRGNAQKCEYTGIRRRPRIFQQHMSTAPSHQHAPAYEGPSPPAPAPQKSTSFSDAAIPRHSNHETPSSEARTLPSAQCDGLATFADPDDEQAYGSSSTVAFLRNVLREDSEKCHHSPTFNNPCAASSNRPCTPLKPALSKSFQYSFRVPERIVSTTEGVAVLPRRRSADDFLRCFWEFIHPVFPVLHKPTFMQQYDRFWIAECTSNPSIQNNDHETAEPEVDNAIFLTILNLVLALGCQFSPLIADTQRNSVAADFYRSSRQLFVFDVLDSASLPVVQMLVLTGVYLQSTQHASRCWNSVGLAIRVAQGLGLHLDPVEDRNSKGTIMSQAEIEMRRRIWYTCVNLDRLLAMTFGRPAIIVDTSSVKLPALIDDEYLEERKQGELGQGKTHRNGVQPTDKPSRMGLFVYSCSLLELLQEVLKFLAKKEITQILQQHSQASELRANLVVQVLNLNCRLDNFLVTIPSWLVPSALRSSPSPNSDPDNQIHLQQQILLCRFLLTRILLLRPLLLLSTSSTQLQALGGTGQETLDRDIIYRCCELCVRTACLLVDALHKNLGTLYRSYGWHCVYFVSSSAIVLLAALKCEILDMSPNDMLFQNCWNKCLDILHYYEGRVHSAPYAIRSLTAVRSQIVQQKSAPQPDKAANAESSQANSTNYDELTFWDNYNGMYSGDSAGLDHFPEEYLVPHLANLDWLQLFETQP